MHRLKKEENYRANNISLMDCIRRIIGRVRERLTLLRDLCDLPDKSIQYAILIDECASDR